MSEQRSTILLAFVAGWTGAGRRDTRSFRLISRIDFLFIFQVVLIEMLLIHIRPRQVRR
ncbi:MAG: hypothetical protein WAM70_09240 [Pyrinomonadaceae bacterium]